VEELTEAKNKIDVAARYIKLFEKIRANVYKRNGNVATSLKSWALKEIGQTASDYIRLFSIGISSIQIEKKAKGMEMACYDGSGKRDVDSKSGGEKVAVALALRFALANLMGKGRTDFIILDEPTNYLDSDRRKSLVELISRLNRAQEERLTPLNQIIIITHDEDVFEGSEVNAIFKFEETSGEAESSVHEPHMTFISLRFWVERYTSYPAMRDLFLLRSSTGFSLRMKVIALRASPTF
jgi:exonuclease SbcC